MAEQKKIIAVVGATGAQGGGLVRAILADQGGGFAARAITRHVDSDKAKALAAARRRGRRGRSRRPGEPRARASPARTAPSASPTSGSTSRPRRSWRRRRNMARAAKAAGVQHVIWSTLEDTRKWVPLADDRMPTLHGEVQGPALRRQGRGRPVLPRRRRAHDVPADVVLLGQLHLLRRWAPSAGRTGKLALVCPMGDKQAAGHRGRGHRQVRLRDLQARARSSSARRWASRASI